MPRSTLRSASTVVGAFLLAAGSAMAQSTAPFWSSYFGGSGWDEIVVIRRGPGNLITIVGHTTSTDLPVTANVLQSTNHGGNDVFIARLDPAQPTALPLWCTYLGGSDLELAFDAEVDSVTGVTTVVGLSKSTDFPAPVGLPFPLLSGTSDGFVAQVDPSGATLLASMFVGGPVDDRLCEVEIDPSGLVVTVAGVTETQLPTQWTAGTVGPTFRGGGTDAFIARVDAINQQVQWATHLGGSALEGPAFASWGGLGVAWTGQLDRMAMTLDPAGRPALTTVSNISSVNALTTLTAVQATPTGASDIYLAVVNLPGPTQAQLHYGTFVGGFLQERPRAIARHPNGGFVVGGTTYSNNYPTTAQCVQQAFKGGPLGGPTDGFLSHIDPAYSGLQGLRYSTFLGGDAGEDVVCALAVETSGRVTVAGFSIGGNFPTTSRCMQPTNAPPQYLGYVARLQFEGQGLTDLLYSTFVDNLTGNTETIFNSLILDDVGDAYVAGATTSMIYPQQNPLPVALGSREGVLTHLPLLPGGVFRDGLAFQNPACTATIYTGAGKAPVPGETFLITATNAPPNGLGILMLGMPVPPVPLPLPFNGTLLASPIVMPTVLATALGGAEFPIGVPITAPSPANWGLAAQWFFFTSPACPGSGMLANSELLKF